MTRSYSRHVLYCDDFKKLPIGTPTCSVYFPTSSTGTSMNDIMSLDAKAGAFYSGDDRDCISVYTSTLSSTSPSRPVFST